MIASLTAANYSGRERALAYGLLGGIAGAHDRRQADHPVRLLGRPFLILAGLVILGLFARWEQCVAAAGRALLLAPEPARVPQRRVAGGVVGRWEA